MIYVVFVLVVPFELTLLPVGQGDSVSEGGDGSLEVCVEVVNGTVDGEITIVVSSGGGTAQGKEDGLQVM